MIEYRGNHFDDIDIQLLKEMNRYSSVRKTPEIQELASRIDHPSWPTFYSKLKTVGGFSRTPREETVDGKVVVVADWILDLAVVDNILNRYSNPPLEQSSEISGDTNINISGDFQGVMGDVTNSNLAQNFSINIEQGNFESLRQFLIENNLGEEDILELEEAIKADPAPDDKKLGENVGGWIGKMTTKAATGAWEVGVGVAASLLTQAILLYYGISG
jgi:hypothetical protein